MTKLPDFNTKKVSSLTLASQSAKCLDTLILVKKMTHMVTFQLPLNLRFYYV